jgi:signal transduction histidine kinase
MLTGLRMELAAIARSKAASAPEVTAALDRAKTNAEQTLHVVRNIAMLLRPSMLDDLGLTPALTWLAKEMERSSGMEIRREIDPAVDQLPDAHRTCLYRLVQEALTNASRHSGARTVDLRVKRARGSVRVSVTDDGRGFDLLQEKKKGLGLIGMEERVRELGGQLSITSLPGRGASVEIVLPEPMNFEGDNHHAGEYHSDDRGRSRNRQDRVKTTI